MKVSLDTRKLEKDLTNITLYSIGFLDGIKLGKKKFLDNLGRGIIDALSQYIDANARMNQDALHHMYEWYKVGSPEARLFDLKYTISNLGLSVNSTFRQSRVASSNSPKPFYDKARIMEYGIPVKISPIKGDVLAFNEDGTTIFTRKDIEIRYPGGKKVAGSYQKVFDSFFGKYFTQAFLRASGILNYLEDPKIYKKNLNAGSKSGRQQGIKTGYTWIVNAKIGVE